MPEARRHPHTPALSPRRPAILLAAAVALAAGIVPLAAHADEAVPASAATSPASTESALLRAVDSLAARDPSPSTARQRLLLDLRASPMCYPSDLTADQLEALIAATSLLPPGMGAHSTRFYTDTFVWQGDGQIGSAAQAARANLTYSFPNDGVMWGLSPNPGVTGVNTLNARLVETFGSLDRGREYIRAALASWRRSAGLTYTEVADDNSIMSNTTTRSPARGDIRIGGFNFAASPNGILAYNAFPSSLGTSGIAGGDMAINTSYFIPSTFQLSNSDYRYFRNTVAHEHGHGLGCIHSIPCDMTKLMEPMIAQTFNMVQGDELRAAQRNYGDRFSGNNSNIAAVDLGNLTSPVVRSVILRDLSTNGSGGANFTGEDWFRFTISSTQNVTITATPTGQTTVQGPQDFSCSGTTSSVNSLLAGNLFIELKTGINQPITIANSNPAGVPETISMPTLAAGTYLVRIKDSGPNPAENQVVQTYDLTIRVGSSLAPPQPIAGIHKRVRAGEPAYFLGAVNSHAAETGATLPNSGFNWDLDGDGTAEVAGNPSPTITYVSNGVYPVTLRLTDSNNLTASDTINVTVHGAATSVSGVSPTSGLPGSSVPVTIFGVNFKGVTAASQVTVSGSGVTVTGTPVVNALGTQISGLSFVIAAGAAQTARNITITNSDGMGASGTGNVLFTVGSPGAPPANDNCSAPVNWGSGTGNMPFSNVNATRSGGEDFTGSGCPAAGPIEADVWYLWTAPTRGTLTVNTDSAAAGFQSRVAMYRTSQGCPPTGAALRCDDFGSPFSVTVFTGAQYYFRVGSTVPGSTGSANVILSLVPISGGCCTVTGACSVTTEDACTTGTWFAGSTCNPNVCPLPVAACCTSTGCVEVDAVTCASIPGVWRGVNSFCGQPGNPVACCPANFNQEAGVTLQDLFDFLNAWFAGDPAANFNGDAQVTLQDLFDFLNAWFIGCPG